MDGFFLDVHVLQRLICSQHLHANALDRKQHEIENIPDDLWFAINLNKLILFVLSADCAVHRSLDTNFKCAWFVSEMKERKKNE